MHRLRGMELKAFLKVEMKIMNFTAHINNCSYLRDQYLGLCTVNETPTISCHAEWYQFPAVFD
jgi:hypothetical protein